MFPLNTKILIVDDMPAVRIWEKKQLNKLGYKNLYEAENGVQALEIIQKEFLKGDTVQLIMSDWKMPEMDGMQLFTELNRVEDLKKIPFIMVSAETDAPSILEAMKRGISAYVAKPFEMENLKRKMDIVWDKINGVEEES